MPPGARRAEARHAAAAAPRRLWAGGISGDRPIALLRIGGRAWSRARCRSAARATLLAGTLAGRRRRRAGRGDRRAADALRRPCRRRIDAHKQRLTAPRCAKAEAFLPARGSGRRRPCATVCRPSRGRARGRTRHVVSSCRHRRERRLPADPGPTTRLNGVGSGRADRAPAALPGWPNRPQPPRVRNGYGGFVLAGREPTIGTDRRGCTPAPWVNVIANPRSAFRSPPRAAATPGRQQPAEPADAVVERSGQRPARRSDLPARRRTAASCGAPTALPIRDDAARYIARHGQGYQPLRA